VHVNRRASELERGEQDLEWAAVMIVQLTKRTREYFVPLIVDFSCAMVAVVEIVVLNQERREVGVRATYESHPDGHQSWTGWDFIE